MENRFNKSTWWIAHNNAGTVHYGKAETGGGVITGQPEFETYFSEAEWLARLGELGISAEIEENDE